MKARELLREVLCLALAFLPTWWVFLRRPEEPVAVARLAAPRQPLLVEVTPLLSQDVSAESAAAAEEQVSARDEEAQALAPRPPPPAESAARDEEPPAPIEEPAAPPPPELGVPEGVPSQEGLVQAPEPAQLSTADAPAPDERSDAGEPPAPAREPLPAAGEPPEPGQTEVSSSASAPDDAEPEPPPALELPAARPTLVAPEPPPAASSPASANTPRPDDAPRRTEAPRADESPLGEERARTEAARDAPRAVSTLMRDPALLATAGAEISGEERRGFATVLLATPEDQLAIARFFGEELVLVPRATLDPGARDPVWFRIASESAQVEEVRGHPPLESYRQYRDLFDYDYARLPAALRELRRRQASRRDVYVFAALIPAREWAVVVARRAEALTQAGRELSEVRRFVLRYLALAGGAFDLSVDHVVFADGSRYPPDSAAEKGARTQ